MIVTPTYAGFIWAGDGHSGVREVRVTPSGQIKIERHVKRGRHW